MAESFIQYPDDSTNTGPKLRTAQKTVGTDTVDEPAHVLSDPTTTNQARVLDAAPASTDPALVTRNIPSGTQVTSFAAGQTVGLAAGANTIGIVYVNSGGTSVVNVAGTVTANIANTTYAGLAAVTSDYDTGAGTVTLPMMGLALPASGGPVQGGTSANPFRNDPTGTTTQPISGTVSANIATTGGLALDATLTGGTAKAINRGGAKGTTTAADVTSTSIDANHNALDVQVAGLGAVFIGPDAGGGTPRPEGLRALLATHTGWDLDSVAAVGATGNNGLRSMAVGAVLYNGTGWDVQKGDATNGAFVNVKALPPLTKGTQGTTGESVQALKDAGRSLLTYFMTAPVALTNADAAQSLTANSGGGTVTATVAPAVIAGGKTFRINSLSLEYTGSNAAGGVTFTLRINTAGTASATAPALASWTLGAAIGGYAALHVGFPDGLEVAAGGGISLTAIGRGTNNAALANGYAQASIHGFTY